MVRYYAHYSNVKRGKRKKEEQDDVIPHIIENSNVSPAQRKAWARLIQKICEIDPLTCPKCQGSMKIIAFIEREDLIKKVLKYVGLWEVKSVSTELAEVRPPPKIHSPPAELYADYSDSQIPPWDDGQTSGSHPTYCISPMLTKIQRYCH